MAISRRAYLLALTLTLGLVVALSGAAYALTAKEMLQQPPFPPTDLSLLSTNVYPDSPAMVPASETANDNATLRKQLKALLVKRFGSGSKQVSQGLAKYDAVSTKAIVPHPRLRAALVSLKGTVGEPAINGTLSGLYGKVYFGSTFSDAVAQVQAPPPGSDKPEIVVNKRFQYENLRLIAPALGHEPLHRDPMVTNKEELIANSIDALVYGQFVLETPSLATSGTELARRRNTELMARLNGRDANGKLRLLTSTGNVYPGGTEVENFAAPFQPLGADTPGNAVLKSEVRKVVGPNVTLPKTVNFDDNTLILLDKRQAVFTPAKLVRLAKILKLDTSGSTTTATQRAQEATTADEPVPSWQEIYGAE